MNEITGGKTVISGELIRWTNKELNDWITRNFKDHDKDVAYAVLCTVCELYPNLKPTLGYVSEGGL